MIKNCLLVFIIICSIFEANSCVCADDWFRHNSDSAIFEIAYQEADLIFLGQVQSFDSTEGSYALRIIEPLKGEILPKTIKGKYFTSCSNIPSGKTLWLVYARVMEDGYIDISICGPSRSFDMPFWIGLRPPTPPDKKTTDEEIVLAYYEFKKNAIERFYSDISVLRKRRQTTTNIR